MSVPGIFVPHSVQVNPVSATFWIDQIQDADLNPGIDLFEEGGSGEPDRDYVAVRSREPVLNLNTTDLGVLGSCGLDGVDITPDGDEDGVTAYGKFVPNKGVRDAVATTTHLKLNATDGLLIPVSVSGNHNQAARLSLAMHAIKGSAAQSGAFPFVFTQDQAIASGGGATDILFTAGVIKFTDGTGNKLVTGILSMALNFGIQLFKESSDGEVDPTYVAIRARNPVFEFSTMDAELLDRIGEGGASCTSFAMYFQKVNQNGERVAKATGEHLSLIATKGILTPGALTLPHNNKAAGRFTFTPSKDTNLLTIATNATIPTS